MSNAGGAAYHVHLGFWTNWSQGKINGATLTLGRREGGLLVAFIAIFVGAAGKSFWRLACYLLHRMLSNPTPQDGIYHQTQAILRNCDTAQDAAWGLSQIVWAWRIPVRLRRQFLRLVGLIVLAIFVSVSFGVAGVFSSQITTDTANEVLLKGDNCGPLVSNDEFDYASYSDLFLPMQCKRVTAYSNYALQCYSRNISSVSEDCHPYVKSKLKTTVIRNASCPFDEKMCKSKDKNLIVDSGYIDSLKDLGINTPKENRFQLRLVHHCAPVVTEGYNMRIKREDDGEEVMQYYYGELTHAEHGENYTQETPTLESNSKLETRGRPLRAAPRADYKLGVIKSYGGPDWLEKYGQWKPIPELKRRDADVMLFFLSSPGIFFEHKVDDPWFSAHRNGDKFWSVANTSTSRMTYVQDEPVGVMGCAMQTQFCNPNLPEGERCGPLSGYADDSFDWQTLYKTPSQKKTFQWAVDIFQLGFFSISGIVDTLGVTAITARQGLTGNNQGPLPDLQWQHEVEHWADASLSSVQGSFVEAGQGPAPLYERFRRAPNGTEQTSLCRSQKITTTKYSSFSVLGIFLILSIGTLIMALDLLLEPLLEYMHAHHPRLIPRTSSSDEATAYARAEWNLNTTLHFQRLAHENLGVGTWRYGGWLGHPVTVGEKGEKLAMVDVRDWGHARLVAPAGWDGKESVSETSSKTGSLKGEVTTKAVVKKVQSFDSDDTVTNDTTEKKGDDEKDDIEVASPVGRRPPVRVDTTSTLVNGDDDVISPYDNDGGKKWKKWTVEEAVPAIPEHTLVQHRDGGDAGGEKKV
ncbi:hypothetical protein BU24DRAFT_448587 [Aaosphaeria arxii CBS 175.79]|uniref:Uncharacterized protein n=1 Tax=Aaosphaeria arxii CBS 175.79 TaxID=1450172 RepID=A0A6A5Y3Y1_9PLEO|nr:uncharacterized protein BU24DRAFT_448587 [Aaosphaeria arxii CBS 175.79]KAF2020285.1 hypothetical protein BU24DRAFT_448587 [Aaosphaeria arxii CBS 175.79]